MGPSPFADEPIVEHMRTKYRRGELEPEMPKNTGELPPMKKTNSPGDDYENWLRHVWKRNCKRGQKHQAYGGS